MSVVSLFVTPVLAFAVLLSSAAFTVAVHASEVLPLKRVLLSTGGVGYFEHEAVVQDNATLELEVQFDQVDDVLKSIVVYDDTGRVGTISLAGQEARQQIFRNLPFSAEDLSSVASLLNALQGAEVATTGARALKGRLLQVVPETVILGESDRTTTHHRVSVITPDGIQQFVLEEMDAIRFLDENLRAQITSLLQDLEQHRVRNQRTLRIHSVGTGRRTVRVGYIVAVPLWKATYRLTLEGGNGNDQALLQGWAVLENMSGRDWTNVELTLVSGNPVAFRQALYTAYYVDRPSVPVEVLDRILPPPDQGTVREGRSAPRRKAPPSQAEREEAFALGQGKLLRRGGMVAADEGLAVEAPTPSTAVPAALAQAQEAAAQVLFRLPKPISVRTGHTLAAPIANRQVPVTPLSLYQAETHRSHPLASVRIVNDSESGLAPGVITLYERTSNTGRVLYLGDARLTPLPAGESRLVSFALDYKTLISREQTTSDTLSTATIAQGVLRLTKLERKRTQYHIKTPPTAARRIVVEHPRDSDWELVTPPASEVEWTQHRYRILVAVPKDSEQTREVVTQRPVTEQVHIDALPRERLLAYAQSSELDERIRKAFADLAALQREVSYHRQRVEQLQERRSELFQDQGRIRDNLRHIPKESDLYRRYIEKLDAQETTLENLSEQLTAANTQLTDAKRAVADYIAELNL